MSCAMFAVPAQMRLESLWEPELPLEKQFPKSQHGNVLHVVRNGLGESVYLTGTEFH